MSRENLVTLAKGSWQKEVVTSLVKYGAISNPVSSLRGNAKNYSENYKTSLNNLFNRIEQAGFKITCTRGKLGGMWGATFSLE